MIKETTESLSSILPSTERNPAMEPTRGKWIGGFGRDLLTLGALATSCLCISLTINQFRDQTLPPIYVSKQERMQRAVSLVVPANTPASIVSGSGLTPTNTSLPVSSPLVIELAEFQRIVKSKQGMVLDARPEIFHRLGHVPGALSVSREEFAGDYAKQRARLEPLRDKVVAVYCSGASCEDSQMVAAALAKLGYRHVVVFKGGWDEWTRVGLPEERQ